MHLYKTPLSYSLLLTTSCPDLRNVVTHAYTSHSVIRFCLSLIHISLQEYDLKREYIPGKKNVVADVLSRINLEDQTFEGEKESLVKIYNIFKTRADLQALLINIRIHQQSDPKLKRCV